MGNNGRSQPLYSTRIDLAADNLQTSIVLVAELDGEAATNKTVAAKLKKSRSKSKSACSSSEVIQPTN